MATTTFRMKKILLLTGFLLSALSTYAQDVIVKKDGSTIVSRVEKITSDEVTYKKYSNLNGPSYTIGVKEIKAINYENGTSDTFDNSQSLKHGVTSKIYDDSSSTQYATSNKNPDVLIHETSSSYSDDTSLRKIYYDMDDRYKKKAKKLKTVAWTVGPALLSVGVVVFLFPRTYHSAGLVSLGAVFIAGGIGTTVGCLVKSSQYMSKASSIISSEPIWQHNFYYNNGTNLAVGVNTIHSAYTNDRMLGLALNFSF